MHKHIAIRLRNWGQFVLSVLAIVAGISEPASGSIVCKGVTLSLNDAAARATLDIVTGKAKPEDIDRALAQHGNQAMIRKTQEFGFDVGPADLRNSFEIYASGGTIERDKFGLHRLQKDAAKARAMLDRLAVDTAAIMQTVCQSLDPYLPADYIEDIGVYILSGGYATGFTFDGEPNFYMAAHRIGDDVPGLELITVHELFHVIQAKRSPWTMDWMDRVLADDQQKGKVIKHLYNGYMEGGATFVADPAAYEEGGPTSKFFKEGLATHMKRIKRRFVTFEAYLTQLHFDPNANADKIYSAGFYDDGPMYFVGYFMAKELTKAKGQGYMLAALDKSPADFYLDYISLCRSDQKLPCFSKTAEKIIRGTQ